MFAVAGQGLFEMVAGGGEIVVLLQLDQGHAVVGVGVMGIFGQDLFEALLGQADGVLL